MNVFISGTPGVNESLINHTIKFLNKFDGHFRFIKTKKITEKQLMIILKSDTPINTFYFNQLDEISNFYRGVNEISNNDFLVILSDLKLDYESYSDSKKWFSYFSNRNITVRTYDWENYTTEKSYLAIAHQIIENLFQSLSGLNLKENASQSLYHFDNHTVCINNFSILEEQIKSKFLSGIICKNCIDKFLENESNQKYFNQIDCILEDVRTKLKTKVKVIPQYDDVKVNQNGDIEINNDEIKFKEAYLHFIYLFFLINNNKVFSEKSLYNTNEGTNAPLISLIKAYNIVYGHGFQPPNLQKIPKIIFNRIKAIENNTGKSTFNSYRNKINKILPQQYGIKTNEPEKGKFEFSVNIPTEKLHLPDTFLGFICP